MKRGSFVLPWCILSLLWLGLAGYVWLSVPQLPEPVATHFGVSGQPNGWMTRGGYAAFTIGLGLGSPLFILLVFKFIRARDGAGLNVPNRDYWLSAEHKQQTFDFIAGQGLWFGCLLVAFMAGVHYVIVAANAHSPAVLSGAQLGVVAAAFLAGTTAWIVFFIGYFWRKTA